MGKKGGWFSAVRKALIPSAPEKKKDKRSNSRANSKKSWFGKQKSSDTDFTPTESALASPAPLSPARDNTKLTKADNEQTRHAYSVAYATARAAEAAMAAAHAAAEVVRLTSAARFRGKSKEDIAAIKIQTAYRGYLAKKVLRALRGMGRLKSLMQGQSVKRQATTTLRCMQTLARVQSQIRARRIRMSEENQALQRQLLLKREKELDDIRASLRNTWDVSKRSKEQVEASLISKHEAAVRRERALAYAHSHQQMWKNSSKSANPTFMDPNNPHWGWSWLERWMSARPWESQSTFDQQLKNDCSTVRSITRSLSLGDVSQRFGRQCQSPSKAPSSVSGTRFFQPPSPKGNPDDDSRSVNSVRPARVRRHSIASALVFDHESLVSSPKSTRLRSRMASPSPCPSPNSVKKGNSVVGSVKKRLTGSSSGGARRFSDSPRMSSSSAKDVRMNK